MLPLGAVIGGALLLRFCQMLSLHRIVRTAVAIAAAVDDGPRLDFTSRDA